MSSKGMWQGDTGGEEDDWQAVEEVGGVACLIWKKLFA